MYWVEGDFHGSYNEEDIVGDLEKDFAGAELYGRRESAVRQA